MQRPAAAKAAALRVGLPRRLTCPHFAVMVPSCRISEVGRRPLPHDLAVEPSKSDQRCPSEMDPRSSPLRTGIGTTWDGIRPSRQLLVVILGTRPQESAYSPEAARSGSQEDCTLGAHGGLQVPTQQNRQALVNDSDSPRRPQSKLGACTPGGNPARTDPYGSTGAGMALPRVLLTRVPNEDYRRGSPKCP